MARGEWIDAAEFRFLIRVEMKLGYFVRHCVGKGATILCIAIEIWPCLARSENRLAGERSPYLVQHKDNPVDWYPWGSEAFERAKRENKPVFVSIGYSTCHWRHVMARESFEDPRIAQLLNEHFVNVKVDRELVHSVLRDFHPDLVVLYSRDYDMISGDAAGAVAAMRPIEGMPALYLCEGFTCRKPVTSPDEARRALAPIAEGDFEGKDSDAR